MKNILENIKFPIIKLKDCKEVDLENQIELVSIARREKISKLKQKKDKLLSLTAGLLLEEMLANLGIKDYTIECTKYGKPYLANEKNVYFNISHSGDMCICAVYKSEIGVDIQEIKNVSQNLIDRVTTKREKEHLERKDKKEEFFRLWAIKEGYVKYKGEYASLSLANIEVCFEEDIIILDNGKKADVKVKELSLDGYKIAVVY